MNRNNLSVGIRLVCFVLSDTIHIKGGPHSWAAFVCLEKQTEPLELVAFFRCNGCDAPQDDAGMEEKTERLLQLRPDAAHMGVCIRRKADGTRCPTIQKVADRLAAEGVVLVDGTH
mgnify:CR=1 FL=1